MEVQNLVLRPGHSVLCYEEAGPFYLVTITTNRLRYSDVCTSQSLMHRQVSLRRLSLVILASQSSNSATYSSTPNGFASCNVFIISESFTPDAFFPSSCFSSPRTKFVVVLLARQLIGPWNPAVLISSYENLPSPRYVMLHPIPLGWSHNNQEHSFYLTFSTLFPTHYL